MLQPLEKVLQAYLDRRDLSRLAALAQGDLRRLFIYDPIERRIEPAEMDFNPADLESVMRASDLLTEHIGELDLARLGQVVAPRREKFEFQYVFGPDELPLYESFMAALERAGATMGDVVIEENAGLDGPIVTITIATTTENEYRQMKEHIEWLYESAKRSLSGEPYKGYRP